MPTDEDLHSPEDECARLRRELAATRLEVLAARDEVIGATTELGCALGRIRELEDEVAAYASAVREIRGFTHTPIWAGFGLYLRVRRRLGSLRRRVLAAFAR